MLRLLPFRLLILLPMCCGFGAETAGTPALAGARDSYRVAVHRNSGPFSSVGPDGRPVGFAAEMLAEISRRSGVRLEAVPGWWNAHLADFEKGRIDALCGLSPDDERDYAVMTYSIALVTVHTMTFTIAGAPKVNRLSDLRGRRVAVMSGSNSLTFLKQRNEPDVTLVPFTTVKPFFESLRTGECDVAIANTLNQFSAVERQGLDSSFLSDLRVNFYLAVRKDDRRLLSLINEGIAATKQDGTYDRLYAKWIGPVEPRTLSLTDLKPYLIPILILTAAVFGALLWQRHNLRQIERHAKAAEEANLAKSRFLASMSHEIRTPINGIVGMTDLLLATSLNQEQQEMARVTQQCSESLLRMMSDILDFAHMESGKLVLDSIVFDPRKTVETCLTSLAVSAFEKNLELAHDIASDVPTELMGDPLRVGQVLTNLVNNAIKFTPKGDVSVKVSLGPSSGSRFTLRFEVKDTGIGLSKEEQSRLFQPFTQANQTTTRRYGGTGLGLAICRQLVGAMQGEIGLESSPGAGSTFWFTLPFPAAPGSAVAPECPDLRGRRILVVEDHAPTRDSLRRGLAACDATVETAGDAAEALDLCRTRHAAGVPFWLALIDLNLPGVSGLDFIATLRRDTAFAKLPVVLMVNLGTVLPPEMLMSQGVHGMIAKPLRRTQVLGAIAELLPAAAAAGFHAQVAQRPAGTKQVLIVDDSLVNLYVLRRMSERLGLACTEAVNGKLALEAFQQGAFEFVLMDCQMPEMDGFEATRRIRQLERERSAADPAYRPARIIAVTGDAIASTRDACLAAGMDDHLRKPVQIGSLARALKLPVHAS